ncbi:hypothetical protein VI817_009649 [Penicillium citrinum]|uniref:Uncharacterized protein n=1 Tax=Penicillium hetheringtonii TaxID=911720 RepID=A0AAD6DGP3_9EURO|nr:hypothetical protein N7450_006980 [Penicillium hetheringtonii]KAK5788691.1 hypothetical protein VI817_009649 [Penicillium citrinum]
MHGLVFHQKSSLSMVPSYENPLRKAFDRWDIAWQSNSCRLPDPGPPQDVDDSYKKCGFMQYADEFAGWARISLELSYMSIKDLNDLPEKLTEGLYHGRGDAFATFDQAGMGQVGDLLLAVEKLNLNV